MIKLYDVRTVQNEKRCFSWRLSGNGSQAAYRILVKNQKKELIWDSGIRTGAQRHNISCESTLPDNEKYDWWIEVTDNEGNKDMRQGVSFHTGIHRWKASWVEADRVRKPLTDCKNPTEKILESDPLERLDAPICFRKCFELNEVPEFALLYATAHGIYKLYVNGVPVSDLFAPGFTSYHKRLEYQCYDVAQYLKKGTNVIAAVLADGWYTGKIGAAGVGQQFGKENSILFQLNADFAGGDKAVICSDENMKWHTGAFQYGDLYVGEYFDARNEADGWMESEFDDSSWNPVVIMNYGYDNLTLGSIEPIREIRTITPDIIRTPKGELILDAKETVVGYTSIHLKMAAGEQVVLEHSETLDKEGNFLQNIIGHNKNQRITYVCGKTGTVNYTPSLSFFGFRYVKVQGTSDMNPHHYQIHVIATPMEQTGTFLCSDARLNQLQDNIVRSQVGNMIGIPMDCPQREKTGWTGDIQIYAPTAAYEQDVEQFLRHWLKDMQYEQLPNGEIPHIIPYFPSHDYMKPPGIEGVSSAGWSDASVILPWRLYEAYGDVAILKENYNMMCRYMQSVQEIAESVPCEPTKAYRKYLWNTGFQYGDWLMPSIVISGGSIFAVVQETGHIVATLMYAITTRIMSNVCRILGDERLSAKYSDLNANIRKAFLLEYEVEDGLLCKDYQGIYVLALEADVFPAEKKQKAVRHLVELIEKNNNRLDTGFLSVPYLLPVLAKNGYKNLANKLLFCDECPSWLYEVKMGATTMWEYWNGYAPDGTPNECSMNHFAFGCVGEYLFKNILGIRQQTPGFHTVWIKPDPDCGLSFAKGSYECNWGRIQVEWTVSDHEKYLKVTIPPDVTANIIFGDINRKVTSGTWEYHTQ